MFISENEEEWIPIENERRLRAFLCACCRLAEHKLPPIAREAIQLAEDYNEGLVEAEVLDAKRVELWRYMSAEEHSLDSNGQNELNSAIRAAICCTFGHLDINEADDTLDWGVTFCNRVEPHEAEQTELLRSMLGSDFRRWDTPPEAKSPA